MDKTQIYTTVYFILELMAGAALVAGAGDDERSQATLVVAAILIPQIPLAGRVFGWW